MNESHIVIMKGTIPRYYEISKILEGALKRQAHVPIGGRAFLSTSEVPAFPEVTDLVLLVQRHNFNFALTFAVLFTDLLALLELVPPKIRLQKYFANHHEGFRDEQRRRARPW
jgi:hypothetical protein